MGEIMENGVRISDRDIRNQAQRHIAQRLRRTGHVKANVTAANALAFELHRDPLTNNGATPWWTQAEVGTGTPAQTFKFMCDTGTTNTWVTAKTCTTSECLLHNGFDNDASPSFVWIDQTITPIDFSGWGTNYCNLGYDRWTLLDMNAVNQDVSIDFWLAQSYQGTRFGELIQDGFIACGPYGDNSRSNLIFDSLWYAGTLTNPWMSYWVDYTVGGADVDRGEMIFGGSNTSKYDSSTLLTLPINGGIWNHDGESIVVNDVTVFTGPALWFDTGASEIKGEQTEIDMLISAVTLNGQLPVSPDNPDNYDYPDLVFNFGLTKDGSVGQLTFPPRAYFNYVEAGSDTGKWQIAMTVLDGLGQNTLIFGRNLLDRLYSEWEYDVSGTSVVGKTIRLAQRISV